MSHASTLKNFFIAALFMVIASQTHGADEPCGDYLATYKHCKSAWTLSKKTCDTDLLTEYTYILYRNVNAHLRGIKVDAACGTLASIISEALKKIPATGDVHVYRGNMSHYAGLDSLKPGDCYTDKGFMSTSRSRRQAETYAYTDFYEIRSFSGRDVSGLSRVPSEQEVLFLPKTLFRFDGVTDRIVHLTEINRISGCHIPEGGKP